MRKELAIREFDDIDNDKALTAQQFRQRVSQILNSFQEAKLGQADNYLQKLISGMPGRLARCKANNYGNCVNEFQRFALVAIAVRLFD